MNIPKISALYESSLASSLSASGTSFSLVSATDRDGNALSSRYGFIIDEGSADEEFVIGTVSGTTVTIEYRGIDADAPNTEVSANKKAHRRGASVKITDYPIMGVLRNILNGDDTLPNKLSYASHPTFSSNTELIDKKYADDLALAGAPDASTTVKGVMEEATQAEIDADTAAGGTSARLAVNPSTLATSKYGTRLPSADQKAALASTKTPDSGNLYMTQRDVQFSAVNHVTTGGSANAYTATLSPNPNALAAGMTLRLKANFTNTGAATLNVNSGGGIAIKKWSGTSQVDLTSGDIQNGQIFVVVHDGTYWQLVSTGQPRPLFGTGQTSRANASGTGTQNIAHGLGVTPRLIKVYACGKTSANVTVSESNGTATGTSDETCTTFVVESTTGATVGGYQNNAAIISLLNASASAVCTATVSAVDATNITLDFTTLSGVDGSVYIQWEAYA